MQQHALTTMIDDAAIVHSDRRTAAASQICAAIWVEAALGFVHTVDKCYLWPRCQQQLRGFNADWAQDMLWVPQSKLTMLRNAVRQSRGCRDGTVLKSVLGLLASCAPAMNLTPLQGRWLRLGAIDEHRVEESDAVAAQFLACNLCHLNGRPMWDRTPVLEVNAELALQCAMPGSSVHSMVLACNASASAYLAFVSGAKEWRMVEDLSDVVMGAELSSTVRKVRGFVVALRGVSSSNSLQPGLAIQIWTDS